MHSEYAFIHEKNTKFALTVYDLPCIMKPTINRKLWEKLVNLLQPVALEMAGLRRCRTARKSANSRGKT